MEGYAEVNGGMWRGTRRYTEVHVGTQRYAEVCGGMLRHVTPINSSL